jgi:hypothetical protein
MFGKSLAIGLIALAPLLAQTPDFRAQGALVLEHTKVARQAVANQDTQAALDQIGQALAAANQIKVAQPGAEEPLQVPLSSDFDGVSTMVPAKKRGSLDRMKPNSSVSEVQGNYTVTTLNVSSASNHLMAAQAALRNGDSATADSNLAAVQGDVVTRSYNGEMPLVQAKDNLALVMARVQEGKYKDAVLPLKSASRALDRFAHQDPQPRHAKYAEKLSIDMNAYAERIQKDHADAPDRVTGWLDQVNHWFYSGMAQ